MSRLPAQARDDGRAVAATDRNDETARQQQLRRRPGRAADLGDPADVDEPGPVDAEEPALAEAALQG